MNLRSPGYNAWSGNFATKNTITPPTLSPQLSQQLTAPSQQLSVIGKPVIDPLETALSYKTSDIIDIDDHLDLVETEDGYLPMSCVSASELSSGRYDKSFLDYLIEPLASYKQKT